jgi:5-methylcytosine-specific restriction endonuclease McrA
MSEKWRSGDLRYVLTLRPKEFAEWSDAFYAACAHLADGDVVSARRRLREFDGRAVTCWFHFTAQNSGQDRIRLYQLDSTKYQKRKPTPSIVRSNKRMPDEVTELEVYQRDRFRCRYCQAPAVPKLVIEFLSKRTDIDVRKESTNLTTHGAYWLHSASIDHVVPHALGGTNDKDNLVTACPACQFGKGSFSLEELRLTLRPPATDFRYSGRRWSAIVMSLLNNQA